MNCFFKAVNHHGEQRNFSYDFSSLDIAFDFLNHIVARGDRLLDVKIIDDEGDFDLPVAAFEGTSFQTVFNELESQWQEILAEPVCPSVADDMTEIINRWHSLRQDRRRYYAWMIESLENQLRLMKKQDASERINTITRRYESMLHAYQESLAKQDRLLSSGKH